MQAAGYAKGNNLPIDLEFSWLWTTYLLKHRRMISKIKSRYWKRTHKYGIRFPKSVEEVVWIDKEIWNTLCKYSIDK